ncbi:hypothetical protein ANCCAN_11064 [Ancylostoma caninum]|uniref:Uncharacterized protein n=1 Tax=Ancylostoma caninum TaxID=29170 RepID=A0A368GIR5_ANCCA|nr:hypothetical protein ANCCAN_11064 [Ancylostoma caninum]
MTTSPEEGRSYSKNCFDALRSLMLELLIQLVFVYIWTCCICLRAKPKEEKSEGRMPGSYQHESWRRRSEPSSPNPSGSQEAVKPLLKRRFLYGERKRKFTREENEGRSESALDRKSSDEKTERKSDEKEKKDDAKRIDRENGKTAEGTRGAKGEKARQGTIGALQDAKTPVADVRTPSASRPPSARAKPSYKEVTAMPEDLALLAAAEQMALDKGDYDNFGPPASKQKED